MFIQFLAQKQNVRKLLSIFLFLIVTKAHSLPIMATAITARLEGWPWYLVLTKEWPDTQYNLSL